MLRDVFGDSEEIASPVTGHVNAYPLAGNQAAGTGDKLAYVSQAVDIDSILGRSG